MSCKNNDYQRWIAVDAPKAVTSQIKQIGQRQCAKGGEREKVSQSRMASTFNWVKRS